jgi:hypothetical protein
MSRTSSQLFTEQLRTAQAMGLTINPWSSGSLEALNLQKPIIIDAIFPASFKGSSVLSVLKLK